MRIAATSLAVAGSLGLAACAVEPPAGPSIAAMPGAGKTYEQFQADNARCQQAGAQAAGPMTPGQAANQSAVGSAAVGTALGAATGALIGSTAGAVGAGAAIGAGAGLLAGSAVGANNAQASAGSIQRAYDIAYAQCMTAAGEKVPDLTAGPPPAGYPYPGTVLCLLRSAGGGGLRLGLGRRLLAPLALGAPASPGRPAQATAGVRRPPP
jgi:hypothetical protein